jgi:hypothetical protein
MTTLQITGRIRPKPRRITVVVLKLIPRWNPQNWVGILPAVPLTCEATTMNDMLVTLGNW